MFGVGEEMFGELVGGEGGFDGGKEGVAIAVKILFEFGQRGLDGGFEGIVREEVFFEFLGDEGFDVFGAVPPIEGHSFEDLPAGGEGGEIFGEGG